MGSSFVNTLLGVLFFFLVPFVNISRGSEPSIVVFSDRCFEWFLFLLLSQTHSGRLPISWSVFRLSFEFLLKLYKAWVPLWSKKYSLCVAIRTA